MTGTAGLAGVDARALAQRELQLLDGGAAGIGCADSERIAGCHAPRGRATPWSRRGVGFTRRSAARVRLPVHRPARLHAQRQGVRLRPGDPPVARRRRDRRGHPPDRRHRRRRRAGLVARRHAGSRSSSNRRRDADLVERSRHPRRRRRDPPGHGDHARAALRVRGAGLAARRANDRGPRSSARRAARGAATTSGCSRRTARTRRRTAAGTCPARHDLMPGSGDDQRRHAAAKPTPLVPSGDGRWLLFSAPDPGRVRAVADRRRRRPPRAADRGAPHRLGLARRAGARREARCAIGLPALERDRAARPVGSLDERRPGRGAPPAPSPTPARLTAFNADVLAELELREPIERHVDGRRPRHPGLVHPRPATGPQPLVVEIHGGPAHALRLVAGLGVPGPGRGRDRRLLLQPARLGGLRPGVQRREPPRLGPRPDARRPGRRRRARGRWAGGPGSARRDRRLVRRLPDQLDRRPRPALPRGDDLPLASAT